MLSEDWRLRFLCAEISALVAKLSDLLLLSGVVLTIVVFGWEISRDLPSSLGGVDARADREGFGGWRGTWKRGGNCQYFLMGVLQRVGGKKRH